MRRNKNQLDAAAPALSAAPIKLTNTP